MLTNCNVFLHGYVSEGLSEFPFSLEHLAIYFYLKEV